MKTNKFYKIGLILLLTASILSLFDFGLSDKKVEIETLSSEIMNDNNLVKVEFGKVLSDKKIENNEVFSKELEKVERLFVTPIGVKTLILKNMYEDYLYLSNINLYFLILRLILFLSALGFLLYSK